MVVGGAIEYALHHWSSYILNSTNLFKSIDDAEGGKWNEVHVFNLYKNPIIIGHWDKFYWMPDGTETLKIQL